jgi:hypothetical protein
LSVTLLPTTEHPSAPFAVASASLLMDHGPAQAPDAAAAQMASKSGLPASSGQNTQSVCAVVAPASSRSTAAARIMMGSHFVV